MTTAVRDAEVAGLFYPAGARELRIAVRGLLADAKAQCMSPKALILPHAGYLYSGPVAASGYACVQGAAIERVVLLGTAHRYQGPGLASHNAGHFATPLGSVPIDHAVFPLPHTERIDDAHAGEHSLEVHLPFLQVALGEFKLVPMVVGEAEPAEVAEVLEKLWGGPETLIVVSSDLSHYHEYAVAKELDAGTAAAIEEKIYGAVGPRQACGFRAIAGLLEVARRKGLDVRCLDLRNSGDIAGSRDEVVGYGAFAVS